jgi:hypothetical protein
MPKRHQLIFRRRLPAYQVVFKQFRHHRRARAHPKLGENPP